MMRGWAVVALMGCMGAVSCGGKLVESGGGASSAGAEAGDGTAGMSGGASDAGGASGDGGVSGGGANAGGVSGSQGGSAENGAHGGGGANGGGYGCYEDSVVPCAESCGSAHATVMVGVCIGGEWRCPKPLVAPASCPLDSCVRQLHRCCDPQYGTTALPPCAADGLFAACPDGFPRDPAVCVAESAHTTDCASLADTACSVVNARCDAGNARCGCRGAPDNLLWYCDDLP